MAFAGAATRTFTRSFAISSARTRLRKPSLVIVAPLRRVETPQRAFTTMVTEGSPAPDFSATDTDGNQISLASLRGSPVILFFMAGAGMGCTTQSCAFRDASAEFNQLDAKIIAISARSDGAAFKSNNSLNFPVINDASGELQRLFGVSKTLGLIPGRFTYVIDKQGIVKSVYNSQFSFAEHVRIAKETVGALAK